MSHAHRPPPAHSPAHSQAHSQAQEHSHSHAHANQGTIELVLSRSVRALVVLLLTAIAGATVYGAYSLWPDPDQEPRHLELLADGVGLVNGEVISSRPPCPVADPELPPEDQVREDNCGTILADVGGAEARVSVPPEIALLRLDAGASVRLLEIAREGDSPTYGWFGLHRERPLLALGLAFIAVTAFVAWWRGILALVGLIFAGGVVMLFMVPALLQGQNGILVTLVGCTAIMYVVLYLAHGISMRTSAALLGTLTGIAMAAALGYWSVNEVYLSGVTDDTGQQLMAYAPDLSYQGLLMAGLILAGLGILNDVTITQASAVWELRGASGELSRWQLFSSAMRIGRDHIASSIYTLVFAYAGTSLALLMLIHLYDVGWRDMLTDEAIVEELARTLSSSIGLMLAVPITTLIAALLVPGPQYDDYDRNYDEAEVA